eukprot:1875435-Amphidinium_carterae.1
MTTLDNPVSPEPFASFQHLMTLFLFKRCVEGMNAGVRCISLVHLPSISCMCRARTDFSFEYMYLEERSVTSTKHIGPTVLKPRDPPPWFGDAV